MDLLDDIRACEGQQVIVTLKIFRMILKFIPTKVYFFKPITLNQGSHGAIEYEDTFGQQSVELCDDFRI